MAIIVVCGYLLVRLGKLSTGASKSFSNILIYVVTPCIIINSMQREFVPEQAKVLLLSLLLSAMAFAVFILTAQLLLRRGRERESIGVERFALCMPNAGYVGIPLVSAVLGEDGVFLLTAYLVVFNLLMFSYGRFQLTRDGAGQASSRAGISRAMARQCLVNPATVSVAAGAGLYLLNIRLPSVLGAAVSTFADLNLVLSMLLLGIFISQTEVRKILAIPRAYLVALFRLVVTPIVVMLILLVIDVSWFASDPYLCRTTIVILSATPSAVATSFMAELSGADSLYGSKLVIVSTLLSVVTMPCVLLLWEFILKLI